MDFDLTDDQRLLTDSVNRLLGDQYIGLDPGGDDMVLAAGDTVPLTQSAVVLENLISQFLYSKAADGPSAEKAKP